MGEPGHPTRRQFLRRALAGGAAFAVPYGAAVTNAFAHASSAGSRLAEGAPSATAMGAAMQRALHQVVDYPRILDDPLAVPIIGRDGARALQAAADRRVNGLRAFIALRSRYAEDRLAAAVNEGVRQYVVLGAGLDTWPSRLTETARASRELAMERVAALGEPWITFLEPAALAGDLRGLGFSSVDMLAPETANQAYFTGRIDGLRVGASGYVTAARV